ncbi:nucleotide sugar dehydrogenase [Polynucleobacter sp. Adler-ghost]|uniref:nucleotide sugar dehydrogenase n=1 Tax=Polynucleobacter sp. Adler-ghost TaxID=2770234 RepID=UPI001BFD545A|nr:nucleotide sugar dehydrogenase [Polynucleobacter sp. Adler-ghost]QWE31032.1 nucleotide sugar dehydrogenase [Polynucleobacter sp. Adler-ghost]
MNYLNTRKRLSDKSACIGIIGLGYVGLPLLLRFSDVGFKVMGFDVDQNKIASFKKSESYIAHIPEDRIISAVSRGATATSDFSKISQVDAIIICVPTPLDKFLTPDLSHIRSTVKAILPFIKKGQIISLESTTYPGTTEEELATPIQALGMIIGEDIFVAFSPEREDPGNPNYSTQTIPKICSGVTKNCLEVAASLYESVIDKVIRVSSPKIAEMSKLLENIHRAVNIGLVNELKLVADKMGIDIYEVIGAASTKPFGFVAYHPGPGLGGHCIPIDPYYLTWKAKEYGIHTRFIELAGEINSAMPNFVIDKIQFALNLHKKSLNDSSILLLGLAYKKNIDDMRESPCIDIAKNLELAGANVTLYDPHIKQNKILLQNKEFNILKNNLTKELITKFDCVALITDHDDFDYKLIQDYSRLLIDTRGKFITNKTNCFRA